VISPFLHYVRSAIEKDTEEYAFKVYMTDSVQMVGEQKHITKRWCEFVEDIKKPVDDRSGDEVAAEVIMRLSLIPKGVNEE